MLLVQSEKNTQGLFILAGKEVEGPWHRRTWLEKQTQLIIARWRFEG